MGRETKNFKQAKKSRNSSIASSSFAKINRMGSWDKKSNLLKIKGGKP
jgi:hypothetical protein